MSKNTLEMTLLFDFYGELLTEKQREYFDLYYNDDLSLSEIAENDDITRQGVRDILKRAEKTLADTESKTGLVKRFGENRLEIESLTAYAAEIEEISTDYRIKQLAKRIAKGLEALNQ